MTIEFQCDGCQKILRTADDKAGRTARCPQCGKTLTVPAASDDAFGDASPSHLSDFEEFTQAPPRPRGGQAVPITCPMCGEVNDSTTDRCLACGEPLDVTAAGGGYSTNFGDIWNRAWEIWSANLGINLAAIVIACGVVSGAYMVILGMFCAGGMGVGMLGAAGGPPEIAIIAIFVFAVCIYLALIALFFLIQVGLSRFGIENVRAQSPSLGVMFDFSGRFVPSVVVMLVYMIVGLIITAPGTALNLVGSFQLQNQPPDDPTRLLMTYGGSALSFLLSGLTTMLLWPIPYMLADRRHGLYASIIDGPRMALSHASLSLLLALVHLGLLLGGLFACFVGAIFTYSLSYVLFAVAYERCRLAMKHADDTAGETSFP